jgi:hypothetical protein
LRFETRHRRSRLGFNALAAASIFVGFLRFKRSHRFGTKVLSLVFQSRSSPECVEGVLETSGTYAAWCILGRTTTKTGQWAWRTTESDTLPITARLMGPRPRLPTTTRPAPISSAARTICASGRPTATRVPAALSASPQCFGLRLELLACAPLGCLPQLAPKLRFVDGRLGVGVDAGHGFQAWGVLGSWHGHGRTPVDDLMRHTC